MQSQTPKPRLKFPIDVGINRDLSQSQRNQIIAIAKNYQADSIVYPKTPRYA